MTEIYLKVYLEGEAEEVLKEHHERNKGIISGSFKFEETIALGVQEDLVNFVNEFLGLKLEDDQEEITVTYK